MPHEPGHIPEIDLGGGGGAPPRAGGPPSALPSAPPIPTPRPPLAPAPPQGPGTLQRLLPLLAGLVAAGVGGGRAGVAGFGEGAGRNAFALQALELQRQRLATSQAFQQAQVERHRQEMAARDRQEQRLERGMAARAAEMAQRQADDRRERLAKLISTGRDLLQDVASREQYEDILRSLEEEAAVLGVRSGAIRRALPFSPASVTSATQAKLREIVRGLSQFPGGLEDALRRGGMVDVDADGVPDASVADVLRALPETPRDAQGNVLEPVAEGKDFLERQGLPKSALGLSLSILSRETGVPVSQMTPEMFQEAQQMADPVSATSRANLTFRLRDSVLSETASARELNTQVKTMRAAMSQIQAVGEGQRPAGAEDTIIVSFQKMNDPDSVVREGEFWRLTEGLSAITRIQEAAVRLRRGGFLPTRELLNLVRLAEEIATIRSTEAEKLIRRVKRQATDLGLALDQIMPEPGELVLRPADDEIESPTGGAATAPARLRFGRDGRLHRR